MKSSKLFMVLGAVAAFTFNAHAAISVGINGVGPLTFDTLPTVEEGWATTTVAGGAGDITTGAAMDTAIQTTVAGSVTTPLGSSATTNGISANAIARWNSTLLALQTTPTGVRNTALMATFQNDSGGPIAAITLAYDLGQNNSTSAVPPITVVEELPGHRVYYSLTGGPDDWVHVGDLDAPDAAFVGNRTATIALGSWAAGAPLYVLWIDDNASPDRNNANTEEGGYTIDNLSITVGGTIVTITSPGNGQQIAFGTPIPINVSATLAGTVNNVVFYQNNILLGNDTAAPFTFTYNSAPLGAHALIAVASDNLGNSRTSAVVNITVVPNVGPVVAIATPVENDLFISSNIVLHATVTDADGSVAQVRFRDGNTLIGVADTLAPFTFDYRPVTAGAHTFTAVATDNLGLSTTSAPIHVTVVQPLNSLIPFGATWKYLDDGSDQGNQWFLANDSSWASGPAELGYGDDDEATTVSFGGNAAARYITTYFKYHFNVANPASITSLAIRLRVDDGAVVYLNGQPVITENMTNDLNEITFQTFALAAIEDDLITGTVLEVGTDIGQLNAGDNVVAVEVHQATVNSSDISFDLELIANPGENRPVVALISPTNNQAFVSGDTVNVTAAAMDKDGGVVSVEFFVDGVSAGVDAAPPYAGAAASTMGTHVIAAVATDNSGLTATSSVSITVSAGPVLTSLVNSNGVWSYLDNGTDQGSAWHSDPFDESAWNSGNAQFGYGEADEATTLAIADANGVTNLTFYFRKHFTVSDVSSITGLVLRVKRDDGAIVYVNGTEVWRDNVPATGVTYQTPALGAVADDGQVFVSTNIASSVLLSGQNLVAVELHQAPLPSSDVSFDLQLQSISRPAGGTGPVLTITLVSPTSATISWTPSTAGFRLEQATSILGPWTTSPSQVNGQTVTPLPGPARFYRLANP